MDDRWLKWVHILSATLLFGTGVGSTLLVGACWVPVVLPQLGMRTLAGAAAQSGTPLPAQYHRDPRAWFWLGIPAFSRLLGVLYLRVFEPATS